MCYCLHIHLFVRLFAAAITQHHVYDRFESIICYVMDVSGGRTAACHVNRAPIKPLKDSHTKFPRFTLQFPKIHAQVSQDSQTKRFRDARKRSCGLRAVRMLLRDCSGITVHGEDGLGGARPALEESDTQFGKDTASEFIYNACKKASGEITLVTLGPLTNIALSLRKPCMLMYACEQTLHNICNTHGVMQRMYLHIQSSKNAPLYAVIVFIRRDSLEKINCIRCELNWMPRRTQLRIT
jgi:hypothetical protein